MKRIQNLGEILNQTEQKQVVGGYGGGQGCIFTPNFSNEACLTQTFPPITCSCGDGSCQIAQEIADTLCDHNDCCITVSCSSC